MFFSYKLILYLCFIIIFGYVEVKAKRVSRRNFNRIEESDYPSYHHLPHYLNALEKLSRFGLKYPHLLDTNFYLGLFFVNVNLRLVGKRSKTKFRRRFRIIHNIPAILNMNDQLIANPKQNNSDAVFDMPMMDDLIWVFLKINESAWTSRLKKFNFDLLKYGAMAQALDEDPDYKIVYPEWNQYFFSVTHMDGSKPDLQLSDKCLLSLLTQKPDFPNEQCLSSDECRDMLLNGSEFGYGLSHRLFYVLVAYIARGCYIISMDKDQELRNELCEMMYEESKYISMHEFKLFDLMLEQITLCTLEGHAQFLREDWLSELLTKQSAHGCFRSYLEGEDPINLIMNGECSTHITAVAAGALAAAVRFILEKNVD